MTQNIYLTILIFSCTLIYLSGCDVNNQTLGKKEAIQLQIDSLYKISYNTMTSDIGKSLATADQLLEFSTINNHKEGMAQAYFLIAYVNDINSNYELAVNNYFELLNVSKEIQHPEFVYLALKNLGWVYYTNTHYRDALEFFKEALEIIFEEYDLIKIADLSYWIGLCNNKLGNLYEAEFSYRVALDKYLKLDNTKKIAHMNLLIGIVHDNVYQYDSALWYYNKALEISDNPKINADAFNNMANIFIEKHQFKKGKSYFKKALNIPGIPKNTIALINNNLGETYLQEDSTDLAIHYFNTVSQLLINSKSNKQLGIAHSHLYRIYKQKGDNANELIYSNLLADIRKSRKLAQRYQLERMKDQRERMNKEMKLQKERIYYWLSLTALLIGLLVIAYLWRNYFNKWKNIRAKYNHFRAMYNDFLTEYRACLGQATAAAQGTGYPAQHCNEGPVGGEPLGKILQQGGR